MISTDEKLNLDDVVFKNEENRHVYELLHKLVTLRAKIQKSKGAEAIRAKREYGEHFNFLIGKFSYIPELHTRRYIKFSNYKDLLQEGLLGLIMALNKFDMNRSNNFFRIANWYVKTRVKRAANKFDVFNVPMAIGKESPPCRVDVPVLADSSGDALAQLESVQQSECMKDTILSLPSEHKKVICFYYGFNIIGNEIIVCDHKKTIADISKELNISRPKIKKIIDSTTRKLDSLQE
jgi:RNA polymerase sigma factor (sigma-70 family)